MKQIVNGKYYPQSYMNINLLCFLIESIESWFYCFR